MRRVGGIYCGDETAAIGGGRTVYRRVSRGCVGDAYTQYVDIVYVVYRLHVGCVYTMRMMCVVSE